MSLIIENKIYLSGNKGKGLFAIVDSDDFEKYSHYKWNLNSNGYAYSSIWNPTTKKHKNVYLHRLVMENPEGLTVDHINMNKLDNRKENLRICSQANNNTNKIKQSNNKHKYKGVHSQSNSKKFRAKLSVNKKQVHLGYFKTEEEAAMAYNEAAFIYYGEFANLNKVIL